VERDYISIINSSKFWYEGGWKGRECERERERERADSPYTETINDFLCFPIMSLLRVIITTMAFT